MVFAITPVFGQSTPWRVPSAELRFELEITRAPSEPCAGVVALLPDSGLLPRPFPGVQVYDEAGQEWKNECLWWNPSEGYGLVFAAPTEGKRVWVYCRPANNLNPVGAASAFCPGLLLYTRVGDASLEAARQLARETPPARGGRCGLVDQIGDRGNPFGADDGYVSYYTGWLKAPAPGPAYLATISDEGSEVWLDGRLVVAWPGLHTRKDGARGEHGGPATLTGDRQRIEYYQFEQTGAQEMHLVWRPPGVAADALPTTVPASAFVHSGTARIVAVETRTGRPAAVVEAEPVSYLWLGERPLNLVYLQAGDARSHPPETSYLWKFGGKRELTGRRLPWLVEGDAPQAVTLTVSNPAGSSQVTRPIYFDDPPAGASANAPPQRLRYREAFLAQCRAVPAGQRPCADWNATWWTTLAGILDPYQGWELLREIFTRSRADVLALKVEERWELEDYFWSAAYSVVADGPATASSATEALAWLDRLVQEEPDRGRRFHWMLQRVDLWLYALNDLERAKAVAQPLRELSLKAGQDAHARWLVRLGDIERLAGRFAEARKDYTEAGDRFRAGRNDWRAEAVRQGSFYEMARSLIEQQAYFEALAVLRDWEIEFPLSKLDGEYPLVEASYWKAIGHCGTAVRIARAYRQSVGLSNYLPEVMALELDCLAQLKRFDDVKALSDDINKRFPNLDLAQRAKRMAETAR